MAKEWTASFPEDDPVYQFFLMAQRIAADFRREKQEKLDEEQKVRETLEDQ